MHSPLPSGVQTDLNSSSREQRLSSFTDLLRVTRAWWPYDASDPAYEPNWVSFEQWPALSGAEGVTLFIRSASEPVATGVIRIRYERPCVRNGLDGASPTTIPADAENLVVTGAFGCVTEERIMEEHDTRWCIPRDLEAWSLDGNQAFESGLAYYACK